MDGRTRQYLARLGCSTLIAGWIAPGFAATNDGQDLATIRGAIENEVSARLAALNDATIEVSVGAIDPRLSLAPCPNIEVSLPPANAASLTAKVTCDTPHWTIYVPVHVHAWVGAIVAAGNLIPNRPLAARDLTRGRVDLFANTGGVITDMKEVEGKILRAGLAVGTPILQSQLDLPISVHRGQHVVLTAEDSAMEIKTSAVALEDGRVGDNIRVENPDSQKTVSATVTRDGGVEVKF
ncbi:MAG: flagellar basal body P-ring formation protein FlgA [Alphaproteobacteria bacterium]|nr:flagellar basal body P-ring formation protein FlgA [Alphaproteobacteria bacterium]